MKSQRQYQFVNDYDSFYVDFMELYDSKYIMQTTENYYVIVFYTPSTHRVYCQLMTGKKAVQCKDAFNDFKQYLLVFGETLECV
jgi:hypothetical protein